MSMKERQCAQFGDANEGRVAWLFGGGRGGAELLVYRSYFSAARTLEEDRRFESEDAALQYCEQLGIPSTAWRDYFLHRLDLSIKYDLGNTTPEPILAEQHGYVHFEVVPSRSGRPTQINIRGDEDGLTTFAHWLLMAVHARRYVSSYHRHFTSDDNTYEVTVFGPDPDPDAGEDHLSSPSRITFDHSIEALAEE